MPGGVGPLSRANLEQIRQSRPDSGLGLSHFQNLGCYVTKCAPHKALKLIASGKLTFDERVVLHRVDSGFRRDRVMAMKVPPRQALRTSIKSRFGRFCQLSAINARKMAPSTT